MKIRIYGTGCAKCRQLDRNVRAALAGRANAEIEKVTDIGEIVKRGIVATPALEADEEILVSGRVPPPGEIARLLGIEPPMAPEGTPPSGRDRAKRIVGFALLAFAVAAFATALMKDGRESEVGASCRLVAPAPTNAAPAEVRQPVSVDDALTVYYFHGTRRCPTCNRIESLVRETVEADFKAEINAGRVRVESVNVDEGANSHFVNEYALAFSMVVMRRGSRHERFDDVWKLVRDESAFRAYIADGVKRFLSDGGEARS